MYITFQILEKKSFHPWKFCKIVGHSLEISRSKAKTHGNSTRFFHENSFTSFLINPWNFHMLFPQPPCLVLFLE